MRDGPPHGAPAEPDRFVGHRRALKVLVFCCLAMIPWIGYLATTLPMNYEARQWRVAWVGFDIMLLAALAGTAWFGWRQRRVVIPLLIATAALLVCDAWFDVMLSWGTRGFWKSLASAFLVELPLAGYLMLWARRLLQRMLRAVWDQAGLPGEPPPLHRLPLFVPLPEKRTRRLRAGRRAAR